MVQSILRLELKKSINHFSNWETKDIDHHMSKSTIGLIIIGSFILVAFIISELVTISSSSLKVEVLPLSVPIQMHKPVSLGIKIRNEGFFSIKKIMASCQVQQPMSVDDTQTIENPEFNENHGINPLMVIPPKEEALLNCTTQSQEFDVESDTKRIVLFVHIGFDQLFSWWGQIKTYRFIGTVTDKNWQWTLRPLVIQNESSRSVD